MNQKTKRISVVKIIIYLFFVLMTALYLVPLLWVFSVSFKTNAEIFSSPFSLPKSLFVDNYVVAWTAGKLGIATWNSFLVCVITLLLSMLIGSMIAFAIARMQWKLSKLVLTYFMLGMMIPVHCVLIPLFTRFAKIGLSNNLWGLVLPYLTFSLPVTIYIMTGFFRSIPNELLEAACIDGCSIYKIFFRVCLPLAKTGLFVTGLMTFVANWNELLLAMVFISDDNIKTLPVSLSKFVGPYNTNYSQMFAAIIIAIIPTIAVYCAFSNQIVDGLTAGAVKG
ncbi:MAG: carbohydrate ABC transporter permease [Lachnospiraceae bacterium]|jgi:raffinose/stachyose/melibiose transport system permease protein|nr:carbohydrate ABC transporter permease [Lachnospiraceae bacterium]MBQ1607379.1 carbohydrate ABC transporter permease [Lachnospiraceae bacterium]MBQ1639629.1 carbohydrate ABC transporter permease [Lachnospiraceae bacterium]MBQ1720991.1 carbohydrate ABC transporter permease [Lachnospiraceae bacterium]MBQ2317538.1 carbohydrate ABC transporter permease [Lachnospiraceae bacterium]